MPICSKKPSRAGCQGNRPLIAVRITPPTVDWRNLRPETARVARMKSAGLP